MPPERVARRLHDILESIGRIREYVEGFDYARFVDDNRTIDAVVRNIEIIGEATRSIPPDILSRESTIPWAAIRDMRNVIAHDYGAVDRAIVWRVATDRLDELEAAVRRLLGAVE
jgi:uncharacterized protein with HEPN domain